MSTDSLTSQIQTAYPAGLARTAHLAAATARKSHSFAVNLADLANSQKYLCTPGFAGVIVDAECIVGKVVTTASKAATLTVAVAGSAIASGGVITLASATLANPGDRVAASAITTSNGTFTSAQTIGFIVSGVTAFAEGTAVITIWYTPS